MNTETQQHPTKALCEERVAKYKDQPECRQALDHYQRWLDWYDDATKPPVDYSASADEAKYPDR